MADDLVGTLKGYGQSIYAGAKALTGGADWLGAKLGMGGAPPPPMAGRLPLGEVPKTMPVVKTPTGNLKGKGF
jgi:hypothetical protein